MPTQRATKSKDDTWTTDELSRALNKTGERKHHRDRDEDKKKERVNGDDKHKRRKDEDSDRRHRRDDDEKRRPTKEDERRSSKHHEEDRESERRLTEEDREKLRQERRERRETKDGSKDKRKGEISFRGKGNDKEIELADLNGDRERRHKDTDRDKHHRDKDDREKRRGDDRDGRPRNGEDERDKRRRPRDEPENEEEEKERRRQERRKEREESEKKRRPEDKKDRRKEEDRDKRREEDRDRRKEEDRDRRKVDDRDKRKDGDKDRRKGDDRDRRKEKDRDERSDRHRKDKDKESEREREQRKEREREERKKERDDRQREMDGKKPRSSEPEVEEKKKANEEEDDYGAYEDDFEDYDDDFEDDDDDGGDDSNVKGSIHKDRRAGTKLDYSDSEVNDVLRALDAENERLLSGSRSPQPDYGQSRGRQTRISNEDEDSDDQYEKTYQSRAERPRTAINFVSAKQRAMTRKTASKTMQRGQDLLKMLELDFTSFDILDMPPVNEYDLYIRAFGTSNTTQSYVQTNDDNIDRDIQTEEVDMRQKWTQHPPEDFAGCGRGDGEKDVEDEEESQQKHNKEQDMGHLNKFLEKAGQVIAILLEEGKEEEGGDKGRSQAHIDISDGYTQLDLLPILQGRHVIHSHFSPVQPNLLLTVYSPAPEITSDNPVSKRGIICVWNTNEPNYPQKILACSSQPQCCCFSPVKPSLVFAGMLDGSIAMWDLREPPTIHHTTVVNEEQYSLRYPTYDTAGVLSEENHHSPVSCIVPIYSYINTAFIPNTSEKNSTKSDTKQTQASEDTSSGLSFQLVSTDESAILHFWVVAEIGTADISGSQNDFGLAPGGGVKLLKSSSLVLESPSKDSRMKTSLRALDMKLLPSDPNQFYVSTDSGTVVHGLRFGKRAFPRAHTPVIETIVDVVSIDFSPFEQPCFLAGCSDGSFSLYHTKSENPLITWSTITKGKAVQCVQWSRSRPCVFYVLDVNSTLYIFDLLEGDVAPKQVENISKERVKSFTLTNDHKANGLGTPGKDPQILFSLENGKTEIHTISKSLRVPEQLEGDYLASYLQRF